MKAAQMKAAQMGRSSKSTITASPNEESIEKLKKKISQLEDEVEYYEKECENYEQKLNEERSKKSESQNTHTNKKAIDELKHKLRKTEMVLADVHNKLDISDKSLNFIKEILSAPRSLDHDTKSLYSQIDNIVYFINHELRDALAVTDNLKSCEQTIYGPELKRWEISSKKSWIRRKTTIALVGEFSAGKTSIINHLLSHDNPNVPKLPVSAEATTAIPTYISGGSVTAYQFVTPANELKRISEETFRRVNKNLLEHIKGVSSMIKYFVMKYKNPALKDLSILDTPGFSSNDKEDAERTIEVINECDALFWVIDVNTGTINRSSLNLIKQHLTKPIYVIINKIDSKAKSEVDKVEKQIKTTFENAGLKIEGCIRFTNRSNASVSGLQSIIKSIKHNDANDEYAYNLWSEIEDLEKSLFEKKSQAEKSYKCLSDKNEDLINHFKDTIKSLKKDCEHVKNTPNRNFGFFGFGDKYEISTQKYADFKKDCERIAETHCSFLEFYTNRNLKLREEMGKEAEKIATLTENHQRLQLCKKILEDKLLNLENLLNLNINQ